MVTFCCLDVLNSLSITEEDVPLVRRARVQYVALFIRLIMLVLFCVIQLFAETATKKRKCPLYKYK